MLGQLGQQVAKIRINLKSQGVELLRAVERERGHPRIDREPEVLPAVGERRGG